MPTKTCSSCGIHGEESLFLKGRNRCKSCESKRSRLKTIKNIDRLNDFLKDKKCAVCSCSDSKVLEFHHVDPTIKRERISYLRTHSWSTILEEIDKCIILCSNCHRLEHANNRIGSNKGIVELLTGCYRTCKSCNLEKDTSLFYKNRTECKKCTKDKTNNIVSRNSIFLNTYK